MCLLAALSAPSKHTALIVAAAWLQQNPSLQSKMEYDRSETISLMSFSHIPFFPLCCNSEDIYMHGNIPILTRLRS